MGKMKELFMKTHYPHETYDLEREYLINDTLKQEQEYLEYLELQGKPEIYIDQTKIEVIDAESTRIEIYSEKKENDRAIKVFEP